MSGRVIHGEALQEMRKMPDNSIDLILTDPPYFRVKNLPWDRQWETSCGFIAWVGELCAEFQRILKPNGSLYFFASPRMSAHVEVKIAEFFNVLNRITWAKPAFSTKAEMFRKSDLRTFYPSSESIIFAEHYGADNIAKGEAGYGAKCDELRGFLFEPLRAYLDGERKRAGWKTREVAEEYQKKTGSRTVTGMAGHWFTSIQWALPTEENYLWMRELFNRNSKGEYLRREHEELRREYEELRREYEYLRREYEELRRPFYATPEKPYTDVWTFKTVQAYKGKHPCEKPQEMLEHIIRTSCRNSSVVLDPFAGSGSTGVAALKLKRSFLGIELDKHWADYASQRLLEPTDEADTEQQELFRCAEQAAHHG